MQGKLLPGQKQEGRRNKNQKAEYSYHKAKYKQNTWPKITKRTSGFSLTHQLENRFSCLLLEDENLLITCGPKSNKSSISIKCKLSMPSRQSQLELESTVGFPQHFSYGYISNLRVKQICLNQTIE